MNTNQVRYPVHTMCRLLAVSASGFYAWTERAPSACSQSDVQLLARLRQIHADSKGTYGSPRIHAALAAQGLRVVAKRAARLMRQAGVRWLCTTQRNLLDDNALSIRRWPPG